MTKLPRLNWDILLNIMNSIDKSREVIRCFMALNRYFYHRGAKVALRLPVALHDHEELEGFLCFMEAEQQIRYCYLRHLNFSVDDFDDYDGVALSSIYDFVSRCTNLQTLRLDRGEGTLMFSDDLWEAFASLSSLRHLDISYANLFSYYLLRDLRSTLSTVSLQCEDPRDEFLLDDGDDSSLLESSHPIALFANHRDTLESVICESWYGLEHTPTSFHVYPKMLRLAIDYTIIRDVTCLVRAYPNLKYLRSRERWVHPNAGNQGLSEEERRAVRAGNLESQDDSGDVWSCLQAFTGGLAELYSLGLLGRIREIAFKKAIKGDAFKVEMLGEILVCADPEVLRLECDDVLLGNARSGLVAVLREPGAEKLRSLYLKVHLVSEDRDYKEIFNELAISLQSIPLAVLDLDVHVGAIPFGSRMYVRERSSSPEDEAWADGSGGTKLRARLRELRRRSPPLPPLTAAELSTTRIDPDKYLRKLWETIPTLDDAAMRVENPRRGTRVKRDMGFRKATMMRGTMRREGSQDGWKPTRDYC